MDRPPSDDTAYMYHSFDDIELLEPPSPPRRSGESRHGAQQEAVEMQRHDSGYESHAASLRASLSRPRPSPPSDVLSASLSAPSRPRARPSVRRSAQSYPPPGQPVAYFQFPVPDLVDTPPSRQGPSPPLPPQPTHYWTSDDTRRLEYAAIDAASRGVRGWVRRHLVPECFGPKHIAFNDDSGSVRRYRLDLEDQEEKAGKRRRRTGWTVWPLRKGSMR